MTVVEARLGLQRLRRARAALEPFLRSVTRRGVTLRLAVCCVLVVGSSLAQTSPPASAQIAPVSHASRGPSQDMALGGTIGGLRVTIADDSGAWLEDTAPTNWNTPGMDLPAAPPPVGNTDPRCTTQERGSESPEEDQVVAAGWRIYDVAWVGWNLRLVNGLSGYDGMCRPLAFQSFVFADGQLAGTISPTTMASRSDGSGRVVSVRGPDKLSGSFVRYTSTDPLCCPSSTFTVAFTVDRGSPDGPLLIPLTSRLNPR